MGAHANQEDNPVNTGPLATHGAFQLSFSSFTQAVHGHEPGWSKINAALSHSTLGEVRVIFESVSVRRASGMGRSRRSRSRNLFGQAHAIVVPIGAGDKKMHQVMSADTDVYAKALPQFPHPSQLFEYAHNLVYELLL